jgi:hypothetical protein
VTYATLSFDTAFVFHSPVKVLENERISDCSHKVIHDANVSVHCKKHAVLFSSSLRQHKKYLQQKVRKKRATRRLARNFQLLQLPYNTLMMSNLKGGARSPKSRRIIIRAKSARASRRASRSIKHPLQVLCLYFEVVALLLLSILSTNLFKQQDASFPAKKSAQRGG